MEIFSFIFQSFFLFFFLLWNYIFVLECIGRSRVWFIHSCHTNVAVNNNNNNHNMWANAKCANETTVCVWIAGHGGRHQFLDQREPKNTRIDRNAPLSVCVREERKKKKQRIYFVFVVGFLLFTLLLSNIYSMCWLHFTFIFFTSSSIESTNNKINTIFSFRLSYQQQQHDFILSECSYARISFALQHRVKFRGFATLKFKKIKNNKIKLEFLFAATAVSVNHLLNSFI